MKYTKSRRPAASRSRRVRRPGTLSEEVQVRKRFALQGALLLVIVGVLLFVITRLPGQPPESVPGAALHDVQSIANLREQFNQDQGMPRLILLLSPT